MSYDSNRISEQLRVLDPEIDDFIVRYNASNGAAGGGQRQTVFFFPGGMASRLIRATTAYDPAGPPNQVFAYDVIWLDVLTFLGRARDLRMTKVGPLDYHDKGERIIVADRLINLFGVTPYAGFTAWCALKNLDFFVFPWDWRRGVFDAAPLFITHFLPYFQQRVRAGCNNADPLRRFSLIGHSAGGMVVNWALRSQAAIMKGLDNVITVAAPFYGYSGQLHRWFEGEAYLNGFGLFTTGIIKAICSFPGCYGWMFLPYSTFLQERGALAADPNYPLTCYPSADLHTGVIADPYDPKSDGAKQRYPSFTASGFDTVELATAKVVVKLLSSSLTRAQAKKFWNIRGDMQVSTTLADTSWNWVPPTHPTPIRDVSTTLGDSVQPAWTARHVELEALARRHVINITDASAEHATIMDLPMTLRAIARILGIPFRSKDSTWRRKRAVTKRPGRTSRMAAV